jgi:hypothetical protein
MTTLREAAHQALEALSSSLYPQPRQMAAIAALRAALAEPETTCRRAICQRGPDGYCAPCHERTYP